MATNGATTLTDHIRLPRQSTQHQNSGIVGKSLKDLYDLVGERQMIGVTMQARKDMRAGKCDARGVKWLRLAVCRFNRAMVPAVQHQGEYEFFGTGRMILL